MNFLSFKYSFFENVSRQYQNHDLAWSIAVVHFSTITICYLYYKSSFCPLTKMGKSQFWENYLSIGHSTSTMASTLIPKFFQCTILFTTSSKSFFQQNFYLNWTRIQHGQKSLMMFPLWNMVYWPNYKECHALHPMILDIFMRTKTLKNLWGICKNVQLRQNLEFS